MQVNNRKQPLLLEDLRNHSLEQLMELRFSLRSGAHLRPDPRRRGFFEVEGYSHVFYIFKYPSGTKLLLIAVWELDQPRKDAEAASTETLQIEEQIYVC